MSHSLSRYYGSTSSNGLERWIIMNISFKHVQGKHGCCQGIPVPLPLLLSVSPKPKHPSRNVSSAVVCFNLSPSPPSFKLCRYFWLYWCSEGSIYVSLLINKSIMIFPWMKRFFHSKNAFASIIRLFLCKGVQGLFNYKTFLTLVWLMF